MEIKPILNTRQELALSPRLYQSLRILRLSAFDLQDLIQKELDENPALEIPEAPEFLVSADAVAGKELWDEYMGANRDSAPGERRASLPLNPTELTTSPVTLTDHVGLQLDLENLSDEERAIGMVIIGSLDDDGYLREELESLAETTGRTVAEVEAVLTKIQHFDPPGIAARDLKECLLLQLGQLGGDRVAREIVSAYLPQLARGDIAGIARALAIHPARVEKAVALVRGLDPSPGFLYDTDPPAGAIIPDVFASRDRDGIHILPNRELLPSLKLSGIYQELAAARKTLDEEAFGYIRTRLRTAAQLIRDVDQRRATVTRVAEAIASAQPKFFEQGPIALRPLSLEDVASRLEVHPSTISRTIIGKYMSTPFGVFEFRYFFASGYANGDGQGMAATAVRKRVCELIAAEDPRRPLSDQKLADLLKQEQISISRRTVAKYREEAGVPTSWQRRREAS